MDAYNLRRADLVQDLINTYDLYLEEPEHLREPLHLQRFLETRGMKLKAAVTQQDLEAVRALRHQLRLAWNAETPAETVQILNPLIGHSPVTMQFEDADQQIQVAFEMQAETSVVDKIALECALGIIGVLQQQGSNRMRACAADPCQDVFIDTSRNNSRRFCSDRCANRYNISAFRERKKDTRHGNA